MRKFLKALRFFSYYFTSLLIFLVLINILLHWVLKYNDGENPVIAKYGLANLAKAYPDYTVEMVKDILDENWNMQLIYSSFVQFKEPMKSGRYVNISPNGFR